MKNWHGYEITDRRTGETEGLHIGPVLGRKSVALWASRGAASEPLAYFLSEEAARHALALLDRLARPHP